MTTQSRHLGPAFSLRVLLAVSFLLLCSIALVFQRITPVTQASMTKANTSSVSPLIFGTNLRLYNSADPFVADSKFVPLLQQIHTQIVRIPMRSTIPEWLVKQTAQKIHDMGASALLILRGVGYANILGDDTAIVQDMNVIFGSSRVYYEYDNEPDLPSGSIRPALTAAQYTMSWNSVIPQLKSIANNAFFIGPVNYHYNDAYLRYFLQHAKPRPDAVSWHLYTCDTDGVDKPKQSESTCLANMDSWSQHFSDARTAMHSILGGTTELPIIISEWNYDPHIPQDNADNNFINAWTTKALGLLVSNKVFASMQYADNSLTPLINNDQLTQQALTMQSEYNRLIGNSSSTPTPTLSPTVTVTATPGTPTLSPTVTPPPDSGSGSD